MGQLYKGNQLIMSSGGGNVSGPSSSVDGHLAVFDGATGKTIKDGGAIPSLEVNIHDLTEKSSANPNDELIISDSENIWNNKKVKVWGINMSSFYTRVGNNPCGFSSDIDHGIWVASNTGYIGTTRGFYEKTFSLPNSYGVAYYKGYWYFIAKPGTNALYKCDETKDISNTANWEVINSGLGHNRIVGITDDYIYTTNFSEIVRRTHTGTAAGSIANLSSWPNTGLANVLLGNNCYWASYSDSGNKRICQFDMSGQLLKTHYVGSNTVYITVKQGILFGLVNATQTYYPICSA